MWPKRVPQRKKVIQTTIKRTDPNGKVTTIITTEETISALEDEIDAGIKLRQVQAATAQGQYLQKLQTY